MGTIRRGPPPTRRRRPDENQPYNIIPIHIHLTDHPSLQFPEVRAAAAALRAVGGLAKPPDAQRLPHFDLFDWLALFFGFQNDNVRNQREHLVLHLANSQMRLTPPPDNIDTLDAAVLRRFRKKLLKNYTTWCSYLGKNSNIWVSDRREADPRRELLYVSLYLLIWGESANLRFVPECICYIFHHMAMELNKILEGSVNSTYGNPVFPMENGFLNCVVKPIYETMQAEVERSRNGTSPHRMWRNYDDINEYFWTKKCFEKLKWPIDVSSDFFVTSSPSMDKTPNSFVGKCGYVEQRSFLNLFRNFDRLWIMLLLFLQVGIIFAWEENPPWISLKEHGVQVKLLSVFLTWSGLRFLNSLLDAAMQYSLVSRENFELGIRMGINSIVELVWTVVFTVLYSMIWVKRNQSNELVVYFLIAALVFIVPELLGLAQFLLPCRIFPLKCWWFHRRELVGSHLREGLLDLIKYSLFWILVLATKFSVSYFLQIKPMIGPTKSMLNWVNRDHELHLFFRGSSRFSVLVLWLPVVLMYLMDLQIWYTIYSCFTGAAVGLFKHLGEIRNMKQLGLRFQFFLSEIQFNLVQNDQNSSGTFKEWFSRLKLRYGVGKPYMQLESNQLWATKFAIIWNEIITTFREEDIISDREIELLELPRNYWNIRVCLWPCFLLSNELLLAIDLAKELVNAYDKRVWYKICKNEYRRCAVIEAYDSIKNLLLDLILEDNTEEKSIVSVFFKEIEDSIQNEKFIRTFDMTALPDLHTELIKLVELLLNKREKDKNQMVHTLQTLYEIATRDFLKQKLSGDQLREAGLASTTDLLFVNAVKFPDIKNEIFHRHLHRLHMIITSRDSMNNVPINLEARRRLAFFSNSLFMDIPQAPQVNKMMAFSVLTPYYNEEVLYSEDQLSTENEDGISILYYLQTLYGDEWKNFLERMRREGMVEDDEIWTTKLGDLRNWASFRGQTLSRTVRGMMYYNRALKLLSFLDSASEMDIKEGLQEHSSVGLLLKGHENGTVLMKYTHVIACQMYCNQKAKKHRQAREILGLLKSNEALRVAYVDEVSEGEGTDHKEYYSVLVKYDHQLQKEVEIYRIKLPGPFKLGEGKPENQNHAIIFTRGEAVQTIDMNQDNYFEEAIKMRNLLEEFKRFHGNKKPTILGVREHIFTGSVSSLAWFMSAQEASFVTLGQRVMTNPLKVRMHYGHPDVFDRFWFLTRGGICKASKVINISEDVFAGFNCTLRGGNVTHHEYIQVGKGRDVGLNQVSMFEAKVSSGNGEQVLSRDVHRLGHGLDFFRMLSFFYSSVGFFFNTLMVILVAYTFLWGRIFLALSGVENAIARKQSNNVAFITILTQQFIVQVGFFTTFPMIVENSLEHGFVESILDYLTTQLLLSPMFYAFSVGTRAHYFGRTILHGGAKYRATGRGFVLQRKSFAENFRLYARSHFIKAIELGLYLTIYAAYTESSDTFVYTAMTYTNWFLVISWLISPFLFNPSGFEWLKTVYDYYDFMDWIWFRGSRLTKADQSWETWWYEEQDHLRTTTFWGKVVEFIFNLRFFFFQYGIVYQLGISAGSRSIGVYWLSWVYVIVVIAMIAVIVYARHRYAARKHIYYRLVQVLVIMTAMAVIIVLLECTAFRLRDILTSLLALLPTGWGLLLTAQVLRPSLQSTVVWETVVSVARFYDIMFGVMVMAPVAVLSWLPAFQSLQTRILFTEAFGRGLQVSQLLTGLKSKLH